MAHSALREPSAANSRNLHAPAAHILNKSVVSISAGTFALHCSFPPPDPKRFSRPATLCPRCARSVPTLSPALQTASLRQRSRQRCSRRPRPAATPPAQAASHGATSELHRKTGGGPSMLHARTAAQGETEVTKLREAYGYSFLPRRATVMAMPAATSTAAIAAMPSTETPVWVSLDGCLVWGDWFFFAGCLDWSSAVWSVLP